MEDDPQARAYQQQGTVYVFANVYMYPERPGVTGRLKKFDVLTGKADWDIADPYPNWGGTLNTAGGLVFYGSLGGDFRAVDRDTGEILWQRKLGSGIIGNPITYEVKGKQYVSVLSGIGGWIGLPVTAGLDLSDKFGAIGATAMTKATGLAMVPQGGSVSTLSCIRKLCDPKRAPCQAISRSTTFVWSAHSLRGSHMSHSTPSFTYTC